MLPYIIMYPLLLMASLVFPALRSLQALHTKNNGEMKVWLFYWLGYALLEIAFAVPFVEMIISLPFTLVVDIYYEAQLALVVLLTTNSGANFGVPRLLDRVISFVEGDGGIYVEKGLQQLTTLQKQVVEKVPVLEKLLEAVPQMPASSSSPVRTSSGSGPKAE